MTSKKCMWKSGGARKSSRIFPWIYSVGIPTPQAFPSATFIIANNSIYFFISILQSCHKVWQNIRSLSHSLWDNWKKCFFHTLGLLAQYALEGSNLHLGISEFELSKLYPEKVEGTIPTIEEIEARLGENLNGEHTEL